MILITKFVYESGLIKQNALLLKICSLVQVVAYCCAVLFIKLPVCRQILVFRKPFLGGVALMRICYREIISMKTFTKLSEPILVPYGYKKTLAVLVAILSLCTKRQLRGLGFIFNNFPPQVNIKFNTEKFYAIQLLMV